jgi:hypothetical protein
MISAWLSVLAVPMLAAAGVSGPVLGYVTAGERVRAVPGIPGASYLGESVDADLTALQAVASERGYAVVSSGSTRIRIVGLKDGRELGSWEFAGTPVQSVLLSPRGTAAAVVGSDGTAFVLTRLPDRLTPGACLRFQSGQVPRAVSDDGELLAITGETGLLGIVSAAGTHIAAKGDRIADVRFIAGTHDVIYTDASLAQVGLITGGTASVIAGAADGLRDVRAADYLRTAALPALIVADGDARQLVVRIGDMPSYAIGLPCRPNELARLNEATMRVVCEDESLVHIVYASPGGIRVFVVPEEKDR